MKRISTFCLACVLCMAYSVTGRAQYQATLEQYPMTSYDMVAAQFSLSDIVAALGTDTTTFRTDFDAWQATEGELSVYYFYLATDEEGVHNYTADYPGQYWMDRQGVQDTWGQSAVWYNHVAVDAANNVFEISVGQFPDSLAVGDALTANFVLDYNSQQVTFAITLNVIEKPIVEIPDPELDFSKLTIVNKNKTVTAIQMYPRNDYTATQVSVELSKIANKLGVEEATIKQALTNQLDELLYVRVLDDSLYQFKDSLSNVSTANGIGWWMKRGYDAELTELDTLGALGYGDQDHCYAENFTFDAETDSLVCQLGQYPGNLEVGMNLSFAVYVIWGNKAYQVPYCLSIVERPVVPIEEMTKKGEGSAECTFYANTSSYDGSTVTIDTAAITAAMGVDFTTLEWKGMAEDGLTNEFTANDGYWYTSEGLVTTWAGSSAYFYMEPTSNDNVYTVGQYPGRCVAGTTYSVNMYFCNGLDYFLETVNIHVEQEPAEEVEFTSVATRAINIQAVPADDYTVEMTGTVDLAEAEELTGSTVLKLYADMDPSAEGYDPEKPYSKAYSCDPSPGFWVSETGYASTWGSSPWGVTYADGTFTFYQMPSLNEVGDSYTANMYLVNLENGKMITFPISVKFVNEIKKVEDVGSENLIYPINGDELTVGKVDMTACVTALGMDDAQTLCAVNSLVVPLENGNFSEVILPSDGAILTKGGYLDESEGALEGKVMVTIEEVEGNNADFVFEPLVAFQKVGEEGDVVKTKVAFENENKRYTFNVTLCDSETYTGISTLSVDNNQSAIIYDLSDRRVENLVKGIYIRNGQKVIK